MSHPRPDRRRTAIAAAAVAGLVGVTLIPVSATAADATGPLLNELSLNPPGPDSGWEFVEVIAPAGSSLSGYSVVWLEGDVGDEPGRATVVRDLSSITAVGATGLVVLAGPALPTPSGVDRLDLGGDDVLDPSKGTLLLVRGTGAALVEGTDYDVDNDGALDPTFEAQVVDGVGWIDGDPGDHSYGGVVGLTQGSGSPDAASRIVGDVTPLGGQMRWFNGDLDGVGFTEQSTIVYNIGSGAVSANIPAGALITPGAANDLTNAAPRIDGPTLLTTDVNKPVKLDAGLSDDGVVRDPDITVTVTGGTLDLADQPGLTITGDKTNAVTAAGPVAALDRALDKSVVTPDRGFEGTVALHLAAGDGVLTTEADLYVDVRRGGLPDIQLKPLGGVALPAGSEIAAFDKRSDRAVVVAGTSTMASIVDLSRATRPKLVKTVDLSAFGGALSSVAIRDGVAAIAVINSPKTEPGTLVFIDLDGRILTDVQVGANPDMVSWTPDGDTILVANEGEPECVDETTYVDPEGSVSIVDVDHGVKRLDQGDVTTADFRQFEAAALRAEGVRIFDIAASAAADLEPEYVAVDEDSRRAWVTLQENNAMGLLDLRKGEFTDIVPLGFKDHSLPGNGLDASDQDDDNIIVPRPVLGMYQPDAIAAFEARDRRTYTVSANEGDVREWEGCIEEEERVNDLDPTVPDETYGRLAVTSAVPFDGNPANGLYSFGARSFSIRDTKGQLVWDSGDTLERLTADLLPAFFNVSNEDAPERDSRSDAKGPEPEGATVLHAYGRDIALVGLERVGGIMAFDVTRPTAPEWLEWETSTFDFNNVEGNRGPEGLSVIDAKDSPTGRPLVVVTYELSNTLQVFEVTGRR